PPGSGAYPRPHRRAAAMTALERAIRGGTWEKDDGRNHHGDLDRGPDLRGRRPARGLRLYGLAIEEGIVGCAPSAAICRSSRRRKLRGILHTTVYIIGLGNGLTKLAPPMEWRCFCSGSAAG